MRFEDLELVIDAALGELPEEVTANLEDVDIVVVHNHQDPLCAEEADLDPDFMGVFCGTQMVETVEDVEADDPSKALTPAEGSIFLNAATIPDKEAALTALHHEIGHALGLSEEDVEELGLTPGSEAGGGELGDEEADEEADEDEDDDEEEDDDQGDDAPEKDTA